MQLQCAYSRQFLRQSHFSSKVIYFRSINLFVHPRSGYTAFARSRHHASTVPPTCHYIGTDNYWYPGLVVNFAIEYYCFYSIHVLFLTAGLLITSVRILTRTFCYISKLKKRETIKLEKPSRRKNQRCQRCFFYREI
jgi:hypothetical protein